MKFLISIVLFSAHLAWAAPKSPCAHVTYENGGYDLCRFANDGSWNVRTYWKNPEGNAFGTLLRFSKSFQKNPSKLVFACNGSASQSDLTPAGLYIEDGKELVPLVQPNTEGLGNIFIRPNGVFFVEKDRADVRTTEEFIALKSKPEFANQSGPMLLVNGEISSRLDPKGTSLKTRNAVCVGDDLVFAISSQALNFYTFATFLKSIGCKNALNLDVTNSSLFVPSLDRRDLWTPVGPIIAVLKAEPTH